MKVQCMTADWRHLRGLRDWIKAGGTDKKVTKLLMNALASAIDAEIKRGEITGDQIDGCFLLTLEIKTKPHPFFDEERKGKKRTLDDLMNISEGTRGA